MLALSHSLLSDAIILFYDFPGVFLFLLTFLYFHLLFGLNVFLEHYYLLDFLFSDLLKFVHSLGLGLSEHQIPLDFLLINLALQVLLFFFIQFNFFLSIAEQDLVHALVVVLSFYAFLMLLFQLVV